MPVYLQILPITHSQGTDKKPFSTLTVDSSQFTEACTTVDVPPNLERFGNAEWLYLLGDPKAGELFCKKRGKQLLLAAGNVSHS